MQQNVTEEKLMSLDKNFSKSSEFNYLQPGLHPSFTDVVEAITLSFERDTITAKTVSQLKCLEERNYLRFTLRMKDLV